MGVGNTPSISQEDRAMSLTLRLSRYATTAALTALIVAPVWSGDKPPAQPAAPAPAAPAAAPGKAIDLVLCLDVSGSMNGLIESAKLRLWDVVNELARMKPTPNLRVALYSYGATPYPADKGWVRKELDLTEDLDNVYKMLNALSTNGGDEYVARVSKTALDEQKWSTEKDALRLIFVAGNEPVDQDKQVPLDEVAGLAKKTGVIVNTIYCGAGNSGEAAGWSKFAATCGGRYMNIDMNRAVTQVVVKTEFDEQIVKLGDELNKTYLAIGQDGKVGAANQVAQDKNAANVAGAPGAGIANSVARAESKAGALYRCAWDAVDCWKNQKDFDITKIKEEDLCDELKKLKPEERLAYVKKKAEERAGIQKKIADLSAKRQKKVDEELAKLPKTDAEKALDDALKGIIRDQARTKGFETPGVKN
jgi:hypothetical protein